MNDIADLQRRNREIALHFALLQHTPVEHDGDDDAITSETDSGFVITSATTKTTTITAATSASGSEKSEGAANPSKTPRLPPVNEATSHANECNYDADGDDQQVQGAKNDMQQHDEHPEQQKHSPTAENQAIDALEAFLTSDAVEQGSFPSGHDHLVHHVSHGGTNYALNNDGLAKGDFTTWLTRQIASAQTFVDDLAAFRTRGQESTQRFDYLWSAAAGDVEDKDACKDYGDHEIYTNDHFRLLAEQISNTQQWFSDLQEFNMRTREMAERFAHLQRVSIEDFDDEITNYTTATASATTSTTATTNITNGKACMEAALTAEDCGVETDEVNATAIAGKLEESQVQDGGNPRGGLAEETEDDDFEDYNEAEALALLLATNIHTKSQSFLDDVAELRKRNQETLQQLAYSNQTNPGAEGSVENRSQIFSSNGIGDEGE
ncbi:hypothetical protein IWX49DRAFT_592639 [Phyllosticta citricarpa]